MSSFEEYKKAILGKKANQKESLQEDASYQDYEDIVVTPETGEVSLPQEAVDTVKDMIPAALQSASMEWMDDALEAIDPEAADEWREIVRKARERSPKATFVAEILTPDLMDAATFGGSKLFKAMKIADRLKSANKLDDYKTGLQYGAEGFTKGAAEGVASDYVIQKGEGKENAGGAEMFMSGAVSGLMGGATGALKPRERMRADVAGLNQDLNKMSMRTGGDILEVDEYTSEITKMLENKGIYKSSRFGAPSQREVYARVKKERKNVAKQINDLVNKKGVTVQFIREGLDSDIASIVQKIGGNERQQAKTLKIINEILEPVFGKGGRGSSNIIEMQELRRSIDQATKWAAQKNKPHRQQVYQELGSALRENIRRRVEDTPFRELNKDYQMLSDANEAIGGKLGKVSRGKYVPASVGSYNPLVAGIQVGNVMKDRLEGTGAHISEKIHKPRDLYPETIADTMGRAARKAVPYGMQRDQTANPKYAFMSPEDRLEMNFTKELHKMKVPRDSMAIMSNPKLLEYKIAQAAESIASRRMQSAGLDPASMPEEVQEAAKEIYENNRMILREMPDNIPKMLPVWIQQMPELFEDDKYSRIDGVVPMSKRMDVMEEIRKKGRYGGELSTHEMIAQLDELTSTGKYSGDKGNNGGVA